MDPKMPKLPAYVFRRQNGSYHYKRNVPKKLRHLIGKDTLYRILMLEPICLTVSMNQMTRWINCRAVERKLTVAKESALVPLLGKSGEVK